MSEQKPCPICKKPSSIKNRPFCSPECAQQDLAHWLNGSYRVQTDEPPEIPGSDTDE